MTGDLGGSGTVGDPGSSGADGAPRHSGRSGGYVQTVLGPIPAEKLGPTNYHEHLFQVSPLLLGDELDDPVRSQTEAKALRESGFAAMIDATPVGLGRRPAELARISAATGLAIVASTGMHREANYCVDHPLRDLDVSARAELFLRDLRQGMPVSDGPEVPVGGSSHAATPASGSLPALAEAPGGAPVRAAIIKTGIGYWSISPFERITLEAAAEAHRATSVPVMVHLEFCTAAHEVLDLLSDLGVPAESVVLAHADRDPDPGLHLELMTRGAWLGYDGVARPRTRSESELLELTERVVTGGGRRLLIGGDVARATRYAAYGGMPGLAYLGRRYLPRLAERIGEDALRAILVDHPRELLAG